MLLQLGNKGQNVKYLQYGLHILCCSPNGLDGDFGNRTLAAVKKFQVKYGLVADGIVGDSTWNKLKENISVIQSQLNNRGFSVGMVDGIAGSITYNSILSFQNANGLVPDGQVGSITWNALFSISTSDKINVKSASIKIFLDPGHGGKDPGALGNGIQEKDVTLSVAMKLGTLLTSKGISIKYSRTNDTYVSLEDRYKQANSWGADLFISIHTNSYNLTSVSGTECFTYPTANADNKSLSSNICNSIANKFSIPNRGHKEANFAVLRLTNMPAILVETAFISNINDSNLLKNKQIDFANTLAEQILKYFDN